MINHIQDDMVGHLEVEMSLGEEILNANFHEEIFSISAAKNIELEHEIRDEISEQFKKKHPRSCPQFLRKVYKP
ncbi:MAG: hypothetical protein ACXVHN_04115 [Methanobacterium sp.]